MGHGYNTGDKAGDDGTRLQKTNPNAAATAAGA
jgi:hypothetical protein